MTILQQSRDDTIAKQWMTHAILLAKGASSGSSMGTMRTIRPWGGHGSLTIFSFIFHITTGSSTTQSIPLFSEIHWRSDAPVPRPPTRDRPGLSSSIPTNLTLSSETHSSQHTRAQRPRHHVISPPNFRQLFEKLRRRIALIFAIQKPLLRMHKYRRSSLVSPPRT